MYGSGGQPPPGGFVNPQQLQQSKFYINHVDNWGGGAGGGGLPVDHFNTYSLLSKKCPKIWPRGLWMTLSSNTGWQTLWL